MAPRRNRSSAFTCPQRRPLIIFGTGALNSLAWYAYTHDSPWQVAAFAVDAAHRRGGSR